MTDQIFYEELRATIRDAISSYLDTYTDEELRELATESLNLPPRPTLADMTPSKRATCQGMQADVEGEDTTAVIYAPNWKDGSATVLWPNGFIEQADWENVIPRPDLPRLEWPGDTPAPAPIAPEDYPPRDQLTQGAKWHDITKLEEALRQKGEAADQAIVLDDEGDAHVWETVGGGRWMVRVPVQQCGPFRLILNEKGADQ